MNVTDPSEQAGSDGSWAGEKSSRLSLLTPLSLLLFICREQKVSLSEGSEQDESLTQGFIIFPALWQRTKQEELGLTGGNFKGIWLLDSNKSECNEKAKLTDARARHSTPCSHPLFIKGIYLYVYFSLKMGLFSLFRPRVCNPRFSRLHQGGSESQVSLPREPIGHPLLRLALPRLWLPWVHEWRFVAATHRKTLRVSSFPGRDVAGFTSSPHTCVFHGRYFERSTQPHFKFIDASSFIRNRSDMKVFLFREVTADVRMSVAI